MAEPIPFHSPVAAVPPMSERLRNAPVEHAEALLSTYDILQLLHDRGVLNLLKGLLGAGDELVGIAAKAADSPESIRAIRNFVLLTKFFASIHPDLLSSLAQNVRTVTEQEKPAKAPGLFHLLWRLRNKDSRHAAAVLLDLLEAVGKGLR